MAKFHEITIRVSLPEEEFAQAKTICAIEPAIEALSNALNEAGVGYSLSHATKSERVKKESAAPHKPKKATVAAAA